MALRGGKSIMGENPLHDVPRERLPRHIAIIMDGNGRWAQQHGLPRRRGHEEGARSVRAVLEACQDIGVQQLTLYAFSTENWKRPPSEVDYLMKLLVRYLRGERKELMERGVRLRVIGRQEGLPAPVRAEIARVTELTANNTEGTLCLAINYGARQEIVDAAKALARDAMDGRVDLAQVDERLFGRYLYTADMSDPDLLIRTASEMRVSNFLLWQISYAELYVTPLYWPEFRRAQLFEAVREFARRERRFGGLGAAAASSAEGGRD